MSILHLAESADFFCGSSNIGKVESIDSFITMSVKLILNTSDVAW